MSLLYPQFLWFFIPLGLLVWFLRPKTLRPSIHLLILALLILALSRPRIHGDVQEEKVVARDILIALDVSYSMRAQDLSPDRYTYAKKTIDTLLEENKKDNIMLIAFTTNPLILSPPTTDHPLIHTALNALDPKNILTKGTSLEKLFQKIATLPDIHREVLLLTDGGEEQSLDTLLATLQKSDTHLTILALGTTMGATVPRENGSLLKDKAGHLVVSRINPLLPKLAEASGGSYLKASGSPAKDASAIQSSFRQGNPVQEVKKLQRHDTELYFLPLLLATLLFLMLHTRASRYLLLLFALAGVQLQAGFFDGIRLDNAYAQYESGEYNQSKATLRTIETPSLQQRYAEASVAYRMGDYKKARRLYTSIRTTLPDVKQKLYYNIANTYAMEGVYDKAKIYYTKALQLGEDADAAHNLARVSQLKNRHDAQLGIAHPKSQSAQSGKSDTQDAGEEKSQKRKEDQPSSGSGSGGEEKLGGKQEEPHKGRLELDEEAQPQPLSSKVYELINKGYIHETQPW
jgi:Ca-activated chloride channel family protein